MAGVVLLAGTAAWIQLDAAKTELAAQRAAIDDRFGALDDALGRRAGQAPRVAAAMKSAAVQEREVVVAVFDARSAYAGAHTVEEKLEAGAALDSAFSRLLRVAAGYPPLADDAEFRHAREDLVALENTIAEERQKYNEAVQKYNTSIELFPNNLAASIFGFHRNDAYFKTDPAARQDPLIDPKKR